MVPAAIQDFPIVINLLCKIRFKEILTSRKLFIWSFKLLKGSREPFNRIDKLATNRESLQFDLFGHLDYQKDLGSLSLDFFGPFYF